MASIDSPHAQFLKLEDYIRNEIIPVTEEDLHEAVHDGESQALCERYLEQVDPAVLHFVPLDPHLTALEKVKRMSDEVIRAAKLSGVPVEEGSFRWMVKVTQMANLVKFFKRAFPNGLELPSPLIDQVGVIENWLREHSEEVLKVTELKLDGNELSYLPSHINQFKNLKSLDLTGQRFRSLPRDLDLPSLKVLRLTDTALDSWPEEAYVPELKELYIQNTKILTLPDSLAEQLRIIRIDNTPLQTVARAINRAS